MRTETIEKLIKGLNKGHYKDKVFLREIGPNVYFAKVWLFKDRFSDKTKDAYVFYFITNDDRKFVAAVLDMNTDLHAVTLPQFRNQGHMTAAMKDWILPHIFYRGRKKQRISYSAAEDPNVSVRVAKKIGFWKRGSYMFITKKKVGEYPFMGAENNPLSIETIRLLKDKVWDAYELLNLVKDRIEMAYGESGKIPSILKEVLRLEHYLDDFSHYR